jgi:hypothetical protein
MATALVTISRNVGKGGAIGSLFDQLKFNLAQLLHVYYPQMQACILADNPTTPTAPTVFTTLESTYGLPAGTGAQVYATIVQISTDFNASVGAAQLTQIV